MPGSQLRPRQVGLSPPLGLYVQSALSVSLAATHAMLFATATASFSSGRWQQVTNVAVGLAWVFAVSLEPYQINSLLGGVAHISLRAWWLVSLGVIALLGVSVTMHAANDVGRSAVTWHRVWAAWWGIPLAAALLGLAMAFVPSQRQARAFDDTILLRDGEIVIAHFRDRDVSASRHDGRTVHLSYGDATDERARLVRANLDPLSFGRGTWSSLGEFFVAEDAHSLLLYDQRTGRRTGCWGASGLVLGDVDCPPLRESSASIKCRKASALWGLLVTTTEGVFTIDDASHERFRGAEVEGSLLVGGSNDLLAVFRREALEVRGRFERTCPAASLDALVGVLDDGTIVTLDHDVLTYCRESGERLTAPWPSVVADTRSFDLRAGLLFPLAFHRDTAASTWWFAVLVRLLGGAIAIAIARKHGIAHALLGLLLGPAYLLAAALVAIDIDIIAIWRQRILRESDSR